MAHYDLCQSDESLINNRNSRRRGVRVTATAIVAWAAMAAG